MEVNGHEVTVTVTNVGPYDGDEVVQLYAHEETPGLLLSSEHLVAFRRIHLMKGETQRVNLIVPEGFQLNTLRTN